MAVVAAFCPACGAGFADGASFCQGCGGTRPGTVAVQVEGGPSLVDPRAVSDLVLQMRMLEQKLQEARDQLKVKEVKEQERVAVARGEQAKPDQATQAREPYLKPGGLPKSAREEMMDAERASRFQPEGVIVSRRDADYSKPTGWAGGEGATQFGEAGPFDGDWEDNEGEVIKIRGHTMTAPGGNLQELHIESVVSCYFEVAGEKFKGSLIMGDRLLWSDGMVWVRQGVQTAPGMGPRGANKELIPGEDRAPPVWWAAAASPKARGAAAFDAPEKSDSEAKSVFQNKAFMQEIMKGVPAAGRDRCWGRCGFPWVKQRWSDCQQFGFPAPFATNGYKPPHPLDQRALDDRPFWFYILNQGKAPSGAEWRADKDQTHELSPAVVKICEQASKAFARQNAQEFLHALDRLDKFDQHLPAGKRAYLFLGKLEEALGAYVRNKPEQAERFLVDELPQSAQVIVLEALAHGALKGKKMVGKKGKIPPLPAVHSIIGNHSAIEEWEQHWNSPWGHTCLGFAVHCGALICGVEYMDGMSKEEQDAVLEVIPCQNATSGADWVWYYGDDRANAETYDIH